MEVDYTERFDEQSARFSFCFTCEDCAHFDEETGRCVHGFPNRVHRLAHYRAWKKPDTIIFCKDFDLA